MRLLTLFYVRTHAHRLAHKHTHTPRVDLHVAAIGILGAEECIGFGQHTLTDLTRAAGPRVQGLGF